MIVYRYMSKKELDLILNNEIQKLGGYFDNRGANTFHYKKNTKYIHFFKNIKDLNSIISISPKTTIAYLCKFDIPIYVLLLNRGKGYYETSGYDYYYDSITEYCLPANKFDSKFLIEYKKVENGKIVENELEL